MRFSTFAAALALTGMGLALAACGGDNGAADEAAIREQNKKLIEAIAAKDAPAIAGYYAEDGQMIPPNTAKAVGREAIQKGWEGFLALPNMKLTFETEKFAFAKSRDVAVDIQTYKLTFGEGASAVTETGNTVVTWVKRDSKWYMLTDMFSSDQPPPIAAPATAITDAPVDPAATPTPATPAPATPPTP